MLAIKNFIESIQSFLSQLIGSFTSIPKIILLSKKTKPYPNLNHQNAAILGNGPSLNDSLKNELEFLKNIELYCVNNFASYPIFEELRPQNYVLLDPAFYQYSPKNNGHKIVENTIHSFEKTVWPMNVFLPTSAKKSYLVEQLKANTFINIYYFNYTIIKGFKSWNHILYNLNLGMPQCQNILAAALFVGIQRKHTHIYLFGGDHSWHEELRLENNELTSKETHFYQTNSKVDKISDKPASVNKMYKIFQSLSKAFFSYEALADYAKSNRVKIYNASTKSYIDTFEKIRL